MQSGSTATKGGQPSAISRSIRVATEMPVSERESSFSPVPENPMSSITAGSASPSDQPGGVYKITSRSVGSFHGLSARQALSCRSQRTVPRCSGGRLGKGEGIRVSQGSGVQSVPSVIAGSRRASWATQRSMMSSGTPWVPRTERRITRRRRNWPRLILRGWCTAPIGRPA